MLALPQWAPEGRGQRCVESANSGLVSKAVGCRHIMQEVSRRHYRLLAVELKPSSQPPLCHAIRSGRRDVFCWDFPFLCCHFLLFICFTCVPNCSLKHFYHVLNLCQIILTSLSCQGWHVSSVCFCFCFSQIYVEIFLGVGMTSGL